MSSHGQDKIAFDDFSADDELVRTVFLKRLKEHRASWNELGLDGWDAYVTFEPSSSKSHLLLRATRVYWQLVNEGIIYPGRFKVDPNVTGLDRGQFQPPYFSLTRYGAEVIDTPSFEPHYPQSYMTELMQVGDKDATVIAYMTEAVEAFRRGSLAASMLMVGVAAERVFLRVCDAVSGSLAPGSDASRFSALMAKNAMKPKLDWVSAKLESAKKLVPDGSALLVMSVYNLMRLQRNDLGHPQDRPPSIRRSQARAYLKMFPASYEKAHELISVLKTTRI